MNEIACGNTDVDNTSATSNNSVPMAMNVIHQDADTHKEINNVQDKYCFEDDLKTLHQVYQHFYKNEVLGSDVCSHTVFKNQFPVAFKYVEQLEEQNDLLMETLIELEKEVQDRVIQMERRLKSTAKTTMEAVINLHECREEMRRLVNERLYTESVLLSMQQQLHTVTLENNFLRDQNFNLSHDLQALLHIIQHARSTGQWEMDCVTFCQVTPEQVFGPVQSITNHSSVATETLLSNTDDNKDTDGKTVTEMELEELQAQLNETLKELTEKRNQIEEANSHQKVLQDQKRLLMTQLDCQTDQLESSKSELDHCRQKLQSYMTQVEQQSCIIKSLQDALVLNKRERDEARHVCSHCQSQRKNKGKEIEGSSIKRSIVDL